MLNHKFIIDLEFAQQSAQLSTPNAKQKVKATLAHLNLLIYWRFKIISILVGQVEFSPSLPNGLVISQL